MHSGGSVQVKMGLFRQRAKWPLQRIDLASALLCTQGIDLGSPGGCTDRRIVITLLAQALVAKTKLPQVPGVYCFKLPSKKHRRRRHEEESR